MNLNVWMKTFAQDKIRSVRQVSYTQIYTIYIPIQTSRLHIVRYGMGHTGRVFFLTSAALLFSHPAALSGSDQISHAHCTYYWPLALGTNLSGPWPVIGTLRWTYLSSKDFPHSLVLIEILAGWCRDYKVGSLINTILILYHLSNSWKTISPIFFLYTGQTDVILTNFAKKNFLLTQFSYRWVI